jgi:hypothetical protein
LINSNSLGNTLKHFSDLQIDISISELDICMLAGTNPWKIVLSAQGNIAHDIVSTFLNSGNARSIITWGITDKYSWIRPPRFQSDIPLPFDSNYNPKPFFSSLQKTLPSLQSPNVLNSNSISSADSKLLTGFGMLILFSLFGVLSAVIWEKKKTFKN